MSRENVSSRPTLTGGCICPFMSFLPFAVKTFTNLHHFITTYIMCFHSASYIEILSFKWYLPIMFTVKPDHKGKWKRCHQTVYSWSIMNENAFAALLGAHLLRCPLFKAQDSNTGRRGQSSTQGPTGGSVALWPLGSRPWCRVPWGVTRRQSKRHSIQGEKGQCGEAGKVTWEGERGHKVSWVIVRGEIERRGGERKRMQQSEECGRVQDGWG